MMIARSFLVLLAFFVAVICRFASSVRMSTTCSDLGLILLGRHRRKLAQECDDIPDVRLLHALAPRRHASRFDAVLDDPECFRRIIVRVLRQIWRSWRQARA